MDTDTAWLYMVNLSKQMNICERVQQGKDGLQASRDHATGTNANSCHCRSYYIHLRPDLVTKCDLPSENGAITTFVFANLTGLIRKHIS